MGIAVDHEGRVYIADMGAHRVRWVDDAGVIRPAAGDGDPAVPDGYGGDRGPALQASLAWPRSLAVGPDDSLYILHLCGGSDRIRRVTPPLPGYQVGDTMIPSDDGSEAYIFDGEGRHWRIMDTLTGVSIYEFGYDNGHLQTIAERVGTGSLEPTTVDRSNPTAPVLIAPHGQTTTLILGANGGYLSQVLFEDQTHADFTYREPTPGEVTGLLSTLTDPEGHQASFEYDADGRLVEDDGAGDGGSKYLAAVGDGASRTVTVTTEAGRSVAYASDIDLITQEQRRTVFFPDGSQSSRTIGKDGLITIAAADGTTTTVLLDADPRFGWLAPRAETLETSIDTTCDSVPCTLVQRMSTSLEVALADPNDPLSQTGLTETASLENPSRTYGRTYSSANQVMTFTSPEGRTMATTLDAIGRVTQVAIPGMDPILYGYDSAGRLLQVTQADRTVIYGYDARGDLSSITDPLGVTGFGADLLGRPTSITRPNDAVIGIGYDAVGNVTTLTPPDQPAHAFAYTLPREGAT